jgi:hypothetical protein
MDNRVVAGQFVILARGAGFDAELLPQKATSRAIVVIDNDPSKHRRIVVENNPLPRIYEFELQIELDGTWTKILKVEAEEHQVGELIYFVVAGLSN